MSKNILLISGIFIIISLGLFLLFQPSKKVEITIVKPDPIEEKIKIMSLDEKIGQMLIIGFENQYLDDHIKTMIEKYHIGGINLLKRNIKNRKQIIELTKNLQSISSTTLFIGVDQEGGNVIRFDFLNELTGQINIKDTNQAEDIAFKRAMELKELGVNMNFSPVLDYVSDKKSYLYNRTFGTNPEKIGELGQAMIKGYQKGAIIPVAKHFPGYGNVSLDPHKNEVQINIDQNDLSRNLLPFQKLIDFDPFIAIMTAHIVVPSIDSKPATLSSMFLNEILRKQMGFKGVIITDDMEMVSAGKSVEESSLEAIIAGADMIISTYTSEKHIKIFDKIKNAVLSGEITENRIDESVRRILTLKMKVE